MAEKYFVAHHGAPPKTSDKFLDLSGDMTKIRQAAESVEQGFESERKFVRQQARDRRFAEWHMRLRANHNIMVFGLGSKRDMLNDFGDFLPDGVVVAVDGFSEKADPRDAIACMASGLFPGSGRTGHSFQSIKECLGLRLEGDDALDLCEAGIRGRDARLYLIVHNLERCTATTQSLILDLVDAPRFHLVASIDHVNAGFSEVFSLRNMLRFKFTWQHVTTFEAYALEAPLEAGGIFDSAGNAQAGVKNVLEALTSNNRDVFRILVTSQLSSADNQGLPYHEYYSQCRKAFLVTSDTAFKNHLVEFEDHQLIKRRKSPGGVELLYVPMEKGALQQLLLDMEKV